MREIFNRRTWASALRPADQTDPHPYVYEHGSASRSRRRPLADRRFCGDDTSRTRCRSSRTRAPKSARARHGTVEGTDQCVSSLGADSAATRRRRSARELRARVRVRRGGCAPAQHPCASMGVALENARLFDETQRLLKETEQRATPSSPSSTASSRAWPPSSTSSHRQPGGRQAARGVSQATTLSICWFDERDLSLAPMPTATSTESGWSTSPRSSSAQPTEPARLSERIVARSTRRRQPSAQCSGGHRRCQCPTCAPRSSRRPRHRHRQSSTTSSARTRSAMTTCGS